MTDNGRVLAFMAHPDDIEILCAGTLLRLRDKGYAIHLATMTGGDGGTADRTPEEIARIRHEEALASARLLDATYDCAGGKDFLVVYDAASVRAVVEIVRRAAPFLVFTHSPCDYMLDHEITSQLVRNACFCAGAPNMATNAVPPAMPLDGVPYLYYSAPVENRDLFGNAVEMEFYVDISDAMPRKEEMLKRHASQREWLLKHHGVDEYVDSMKRWCKEAGNRIGARYAEGFRQHRGHAYPQDNELARLLD